VVGEIYLAEVFFTDFSSSRVRPVLILSEEGQDVLFLPLTTNLSQPGVLISSKDLEEGHLRKDSVVVVHKIGLLHKSLLLKKLARVKEDPFLRIKRSLCEKLSCL